MATVRTVRRRRMSKLRLKEAIQGYLFLAPTLILFTVFSLITVLMGFVYSFTDMTRVGEDFNWTLANFQYIFSDKMYLHSILNVLIFALMSVPLTIVSSLLVAALLNRKIKGIKVFRVLYYLPAITSGIATAFIWKWLFNDHYGLLNTIITKLFGGEGIKWISSQSYFAMFCIAIVSAWTGLGGNTLVYLAGMRSISPELYEAADLDGANGFQKLMHITVPLLSPTTYFIMTMSLIGAFQLYDVVAMMGATGYYTQTPVMYIVDSFGKLKIGEASAQSVVLFVVIMVVTFITQSVVREKK